MLTAGIHIYPSSFTTQALDFIEQALLPRQSFTNTEALKSCLKSAQIKR